MDVSIVMINYNTFNLTKNAIESIVKYTKEIDYDIYLIDNLSPDNSGLKLKELYNDNDHIKVILAPENLGTSKAFNFCAKMTDAKYVLWINSDILLIDNFIKKLYDFMEKTPSAAICGGNLVGPDYKPLPSMSIGPNNLRNIKNSSNKFYKLMKKVFRVKHHNYNFKKQVIEVKEIIGADLFVRNNVFKKIGYLNEEIFMYGEDTEFCFRAIKNGYKIYSIPYASMIHLEGGSSSGVDFSKKKHKIYLEGTSIFLQKCYGPKVQKKFFYFELRKYKKYYWICKMLKKNRIQEFEEKIAIVNSLIIKYFG